MATFILSTILGVAIVSRLSRLIAVDYISEKARDRVTTRLGFGSGIVYLLHCQWCLSIYLGAATAGIVVWLSPAPDLNPAFQVVGLAALFSLTAGIIGEHYGASLDDGEGEA